MGDRIPPSSLEAEMAVLGACMLDREALEVALEVLRPADFYAAVHEQIFGALARLEAENRPADKLAVAEDLRSRGQLDNVGGLPYLSSLLHAVPTASSVAYYAAVVAEKAQLRALMAVGREIESLGQDGEDDVPAAIARAEVAFSQALDRRSKSLEPTSIGDAMTAAYIWLAERAGGSVESTAMFSPWPSLSELTGPFLPGDFVLWPAAGGTGKSALLVGLADYLAAHYGPTMIASLEMSSLELAMRYGAMYGEVSVRRQRTAGHEGQAPLSDAELERLYHAGETLRARPIVLHDFRTVSSLADLRRALRKQARKAPVRALVLDGLNLLTDVDTGGRVATKNDRLDVVYKSLVRIAKEFDVVLHAAQHVNRDGMKSAGPPTLANIRDGGNPEGHANAIICPHRPTPNGTAEQRAIGQFVILKAREGIAETVDGLEFVGHRSLWVEKGRVPWFEAASSREMARDDGDREPEFAF
jgi:replicative DNA helicase